MKNILKHWIISFILLVINYNDLLILSIHANDTETIDAALCTLNNLQRESKPFIVIREQCSVNSTTNILFRNSEVPIISKSIFDFYEELKSFDISNTHVAYLDYQTFLNAKKLNTLNMSGNKLTKIDKYWFLGADSLTSLDIMNNEIKTIENNAFHGLSNLERLDLSINKIQRLVENIFDPLVKLENIRLNDNEIEVIDDLLFHNNKELKYVYLSSNKIVIVDSLAFQNTHLSYLDLANNPTLDKINLKNLLFIKAMYLSNASLNDLTIPGMAIDISASSNKISRIYKLYESMHLRRLELSNNFISNLTQFAPFEQLEKLDLSNNLIKDNNLNQLPTLPHLLELNLQQNQIHNIRVHDFKSSFPILKEILLSKNDWTDEETESLAKQFNSIDVKLILNSGKHLDTSTTSQTSPIVFPESTEIFPSPTPTHHTTSPITLEQLNNEIQKNFTILETKIKALMASSAKNAQHMADESASLHNSLTVIKVLFIILSLLAFGFIFYKYVLPHININCNWPIYRRNQQRFVQARSSDTLNYFDENI